MRDSRDDEMSTFDSPYQHLELDYSRVIRLLQFKNGSADESAGLTLTLTSFNLDTDSPEYDALSYTWGPPLKTPDCDAAYGPDHDVTIWLESSEEHTGFLKVGRNLYEALLQLRQLKIKQASDEANEKAPNLAPWIWIDAICINQQNEAEKSQQVAIMDEIYAKARTVIAWLGQDDGTFEHVAEFYTECAEKMFAWVLHSDTQEERVPASYERITGGILIRDIGMKIPDDIIRSVALFNYRRRYLVRLWVCQEIALARSPFVLLGDRMLPFRVFAECSLFIRYNRAVGEVFAQTIRAHDQTSDSYISGFDQIDYLREINVQAELPRNTFKTLYGRDGDDREVFCLTLLLCLEQCHMNVCSDPRDRIFALLAIAKTNLPPDARQSLVPDYTIPYEQLYFDVASTLLTILPYLTLLGVVNHRPGEVHERRPSWVPTFGLEHSLKGNLISLFRMHTLPGRRRPYNASGKFEYSSGISSFTESELNLSGKQISAVRTCFLHINNTGKAFADLIKAQLDLMLFLFASFEKLSRHGRVASDIYRVILQTMTLDDLGGGSIDKEIRSFRAWMTGSIAILRRQHHDQPLTSDEYLEALAKALDSIASIPGAPSEEDVQEWLTAFAEEEDQGATMAKYNRETSHFLSDYSAACLGRSIFMTEDSMGLGPLAVLPDDQIWILVPGRVPYILRPTEDQGRYLFIGEAYLHGVMFGEAAEGISEDELDDITLI